jgi:hypothetical protein
MSIRLSFNQRWLWIFFIIILFAISLWKMIPYKKTPCYSPNHEYYIARLQDLKSYLTPGIFGTFGKIRIYDRNDKFLNETFTHLDEQMGPYWSAPSREVFYLGSEMEGILKTPKSPGAGIGCY